MPIESLHLENMRCFSRRQGGRIGRITLLTGENSSGKSTFLAARYLVSNLLHGDFLNFNSEPFFLGSFGDIITTTSEMPTVQVGFTIEASGRLQANFNERTLNLIGDSDSGHILYKVLSKFKDIHGEPILELLDVQIGACAVHFDLSLDQVPTVTLSYGSETIDITSSASFPAKSKDISSAFKGLMFVLNTSTLFALKLTDTESSESDFSQDFSAALNAGLMRIYVELSGGLLHAYAPFRSIPKRTYDPFQIRQDPQGRHVPMKLARLQRSDRPKWKELRHQIERYGDSSGLFQEIEVRNKFGQSTGDPFQLMVRVKGSKVNIIDAGYGVSQILPILVDTLAEGDSGVFLLQQPEVHLHPSAQAELGSFFWDRVQESEQSFVIETHSDHLADRIRMEIRDRKIDPSMLSFLYFENTVDGAFIREIRVSENGELVDPPSSYRNFFLREELRLLGFSGENGED
ncbi:MAG: AAA family ATPase [Bryobacterales bacterium]|nr:AAA family ATPase [Bryobacterales bacterium]